MASLDTMNIDSGRDSRPSPSVLIKRVLNLKQDNEMDYNISACPICENEVTCRDGVMICCKCGAELGPEIRFTQDTQYNANEQQGQCNNIHNPLLTETNYTTGIAGNGGNSQLQKLNKWSHIPYLEKVLSKGFRTLDESCRAAGLNHIISQQSQILYKELVNTALESNKKRPMGLLEASLYHTCLKNGVSRSHKEIASVLGSTENKVIKGCKVYSQLMSHDDLVSDRESYLIRYADGIGMTHEQIGQVRTIINRTMETGLFNENIQSVIAAGIYLASVIYNYNFTKMVISQQTGISEVTVIKIYKKMTKHLNKIIN